jgi:hypothetical protein
MKFFHGVGVHYAKLNKPDTVRNCMLSRGSLGFHLFGLVFAGTVVELRYSTTHSSQISNTFYSGCCRDGVL